MDIIAHNAEGIRSRYEVKSYITYNISHTSVPMYPFIVSPDLSVHRVEAHAHLPDLPPRSLERAHDLRLERARRPDAQRARNVCNEVDEHRAANAHGA